jgi:hypothetical protein
VPLKDKALPDLPWVVQVAPLSVPLFPFPDESAVTLPLPSLKPYAATKLGVEVCAKPEEVQPNSTSRRNNRVLTGVKIVLGLETTLDGEENIWVSRSFSQFMRARRG